MGNEGSEGGLALVAADPCSWWVKTVAQLGVVVTLATELAVANTNGQL